MFPIQSYSGNSELQYVSYQQPNRCLTFRNVGSWRDLFRTAARKTASTVIYEREALKSTVKDIKEQKKSTWVKFHS